MCGSDGIWRGNYFRGEPTGRAEVEVRVGKFKSGKATCNEEFTGGMIKSGGDRVVDWIWRLCHMAFESGVGPEDWISAVIIPLHKSKGERTEYKNYRGISLSVAGKIYASILHKVTGDLIDDEQRGFRVGRGM